MRTLAAIILILLLAILTGCKTRTEVQYVPQVHHDTLRLVTLDHRVDSVHDSVYVTNTIYTQNDTIHVTTTTYRDRVKYRDRLIRDTLYRVKADTITKAVTITAPLTNWQRMQMTLGRIAIAILLAAVGLGAAWVWYRRYI